MDGIYNNKREVNNNLTKESLIIECILLLKKVRQSKPLIHVIPNMVSASFVADAVSCVGARPIMAIAKEEVEEITSHADALVVNMGQPSQEKEKAVLVSLETAKNCKIPVVIDPVGAGASSYRREMMGKIINDSWEGIIKGNYFELETLQNGILQFQGVDSVNGNDILPPKESNRIFVMTGDEDIIMTSKTQYRLSHISKEQPYKIVGTGCVAAGLCGVYSSVAKEKEIAAVTALSVLSIALEKVRNIKGYGSYKMAVLNQLSEIDKEELQLYLEEILIIESI